MKVLWNKEDQKCGVWEPGAFCIKQSGPNEIGRAPSKPGREGGSWRKSLLRGQPHTKPFESDLVERKEKGFRAFSFISS